MSTRRHKLDRNPKFDTECGSILLRSSNFAWLPENARKAARDAVDTHTVDALLVDFCDHSDPKVNERLRDVLLQACAELRTHDLMQRLRGVRHA